MTIADFFTQLWDTLKTDFGPLIQGAEQVAADLETKAVADIEDVFTHGMSIAIKAIKAEAGKVLSGQEKFGNAVTAVMQALEAKLGPVLIQDVQALVQVAFRGLQKVL